jgi:hypothetical protein
MGWQLPHHLQREQRQLEAAGVTDWHTLASLPDGALLHLAADGRASAQRLRLLRGQARLVHGVGLEPPVAALLLHAGVDSAASLASADPQQLLVQVGRLQRHLLGPLAASPSLAEVRQWIQLARRARN